MFTKFTAFADIPKDAQPKALQLKDETWVLDDSTDVDKLTTTNTAIRKERDDFEKASKDAATLAATTKRELDAIVATQGASSQKVADMLKQWEIDKDTAVATAVAEKDKLIASLSGRVTSFDLDDKLKERFKTKENGGRPERESRMLTQAKADGWVLEGDKQVRKNPDGTLSTQSFDDYLKELKKEIPEWFLGTKAAGGSAPGGPTGTVAGLTDLTAKKPTEWTSEERRTFIEEHGQPAYRELLNKQVQASMEPAPAAAK